MQFLSSRTVLCLEVTDKLEGWNRRINIHATYIFHWKHYNENNNVTCFRGPIHTVKFPFSLL